MTPLYDLYDLPLNSVMLMMMYTIIAAYW